MGIGWQGWVVADVPIFAKLIPAFQVVRTGLTSHPQSEDVWGWD